MIKNLKQVDWESRGVERVFWEIVSVPNDKTIEQFKTEKKAAGFEVVAETEDLKGGEALFIEMDAVVFDRDIKPLREKEKVNVNKVI